VRRAVLPVFPLVAALLATAAASEDVTGHDPNPAGPLLGPVVVDSGVDGADCPAPRPGTLTLNTVPWTVVVIDGVVVGTTPLFRHELPAGKHMLTLVNEGRGVDVDEEVVIDEGHAHKLKLVLATTGGEAVLDDRGAGADVTCIDDDVAAYVTVDTRPWSKVWIDGRLAGVTPVFQHKVAAGAHAVRVMSGAGALRTATFVATAGEVVKVVLQLDVDGPVDALRD
jgi:hypothetical protein